MSLEVSLTSSTGRAHSRHSWASVQSTCLRVILLCTFVFSKLFSAISDFPVVL